MTQRFADDPQSIPGGRVIAKAVIKTYTAGTHKSDVQLVGSHPTVLSAIRVATDIPAADVVAGRQCTVLFLDPANQDDAVVLCIQGALPSGGGGGGGTASDTVVSETTFGLTPAAGIATPYSRGDHTHGSPTDPVTAHVAAADPHTVYGALAQAETWAALQTFSAGLKLAAAQAIQDSGGTARLTPATTTPHITLTGEARLGDRAGVGVDPTSTSWLFVSPSGTITSGTHALIRAEPAVSLGIGGSNITVYGVRGFPIIGITAGPWTGIAIDGLNYVPGISTGGAGTVVDLLRAVVAQPAVVAFTGTVSHLAGLTALAPLYQSIPAGGSITLAVGVDIGNYGASARGVDVYGLRLADTTLNTGFSRLLEIGGTLGTLPNLRLEGRAPAVSGDSKLLLAFYDGAAVGLRRVVMGAANSGGAGFRALLVAN